MCGIFYSLYFQFLNIPTASVIFRFKKLDLSKLQKHFIQFLVMTAHLKTNNLEIYLLRCLQPANSKYFHIEIQ